MQRINKTTFVNTPNTLNQNSTNSIDTSKFEQEIQYFKDLYDSKFSNIKTILSQPTKSYKLKLHESFKPVVKGDLFIRNEYQNIYCIYGKIEITSANLIIPLFILPEPHNSKYSIVILAKSDDNTINNHKFIYGLVKDNTLTLYPKNLQCTIELCSVISLPGLFPKHVNF